MGFGLTNRGQLRDFNEPFSTNMLRSVFVARDASAEAEVF
jgi:hypothetical protein